MRSPFHPLTSSPLSLSRKVALASLAVWAAAAIVAAQVNIQSDVINFRTSSDKNTTTQHYGEMELDADANSTGTVIDATNTSTSASDGIAVKGTSVPQANHGIGGDFTGGYHGVDGSATISGTGYRVGGQFTASGGSSGNYGVIASGNTWAGYFTGSSIYVNGTTYPSDAKLKLNEQAIHNALPKLMRLKPRTYEYDTASYQAMGLPTGKQVGFIAQELEDVLPELVAEVSPPPSRGDGALPQASFKGLNYTGLIPMLVAAMQEQQATIEEQNRRIEQLENLVK